MKDKIKLFLGTPISNKVDDRGQVLPKYKRTLETFINDLESAGCSVFCAIKDEGWQMNKSNDSAKAQAYDNQMLAQSDIAIFLLEDTISAGMQYEIGFAHALKLPVYLCYQNQTKLSWTNQAISGLDGVEAIVYQDHSDLITKLSKVFTSK